MALGTLWGKRKWNWTPEMVKGPKSKQLKVSQLCQRCTKWWTSWKTFRRHKCHFRSPKWKWDNGWQLKKTVWERQNPKKQQVHGDSQILPPAVHVCSMTLLHVRNTCRGCRKGGVEMKAKPQPPGQAGELSLRRPPSAATTLPVARWWLQASEGVSPTGVTVGSEGSLHSGTVTEGGEK